MMDYRENGGMRHSFKNGREEAGKKRKEEKLAKEKRNWGKAR